MFSNLQSGLKFQLNPELESWVAAKLMTAQCMGSDDGLELHMVKIIMIIVSFLC